ncbi:MAG TPA: hypothetical protein VF627_11080, partial [Abditibacterium sp.]
MALLNKTTRKPEEKLVINNTAYVARARWVSFSNVFLCVCLASLIAAFVLAVSALPGHKQAFFIAALLLLTVAAIVKATGQSGTYSFPRKLLEETVKIAQPTGFDRIVEFTIAMDKTAFVVAAFLTLVASLALFNFSDVGADSAKSLARSLGHLKVVLYIATAVLVFTTLFWNFTLRWSLAYIFPYSGPVYESVEAIVNSMIFSRGLYFTMLL